MTSYMISLRQASDGAKLGTPRFLAVDDAGATAPLGQSAWLKAVLDQFPKVNGLPSGDLVFFVHGFNVGFASALRDHRDCMARLEKAGWPGKFISFDWPSFGSVLHYYDDRSLARQSANLLIDTAMAMFVRALNPACNVTVSVMAHSMGAFVVRQAFANAYQDTKINAKDWKIAQLLLVAGDVSQDSLSAAKEGGKLTRYVGRTTLYSNRFDGVLQVSDVKNGDPTPRAGRVGLPADAPASFVGVDTSDFYSSLRLGLGDAFNPATPHTYYFGQDGFWRDVVLNLGGGLDRNVFPTRDPTGPVNRFRLKTTAVPDADYANAVTHAFAATDAVG
jgi:hypothetical protein